MLYGYTLINTHVYHIKKKKKEKVKQQNLTHSLITSILPFISCSNVFVLIMISLSKLFDYKSLTQL